MRQDVFYYSREGSGALGFAVFQIILASFHALFMGCLAIFASFVAATLITGIFVLAFYFAGSKREYL